MKKIKVLSLSILILSVFITGCGKSNDVNEEVTINKKVKVQEIVEQNDISSKLTLSGTVVPQEYSMIRSLTPGTIEYLAPIGSEVYAGQPLFSIRDAGVENNYFNTLQSYQQTQITSNQRTQQAELALNSAKARLDLARVQYNNALVQTDQTLSTIQDSSVVLYNSAYNTLNQFYLFLNKSLDLKDTEYIYNDLLTPQSQFKSSTQLKFNNALNYFTTISNTTTVDDLQSDMPKLQQALELAKGVVDDTVILLQNAVDSSIFPTATIESDKTTMVAYQTAINTHLSGIISSINSVINTGISNNLAINNAQAQLNLAEIEYNNSEVALQNAKDGAGLEQSMSQAQLDAAAYNYNNLNLPSPFSGTILSHFAKAGEQVSVGQELIEIGNLSIVEITIDVDVDFAKAIKLGDPVMINNTYKGFVTEVDPIGDLKSGKVSVTVQSQEAGAGLVAGSTAEVEFSLTYSNVNAIVVPIKSVTIESSGNYVFVVNEDNKVLRKNVSLGEIYGDKVAILDGLEVGDRLILLNGVFVSVDDEVEIVN